jgi:hypothetical protein
MIASKTGRQPGVRDPVIDDHGGECLTGREYEARVCARFQHDLPPIGFGRR